MRRMITKAAGIVAAMALTAALAAGATSAFAANTIDGTATLDTPITVTIDSPGATPGYTFTAPEGGAYVIESSSIDGEDDDFDPYLTVYNEDWEGISENDDGGSGLHFKLTLPLEEGETIILQPRMASEDDTGSFTMTVTQLDASSLDNYYDCDATVYYSADGNRLSAGFLLRCKYLYDATLAYGEDFVIDYFLNEEGEQVTLDDITLSGSYYAHCVPAEDSGCTGSIEVWTKVVDLSDLQYTQLEGNGTSYYASTGIILAEYKLYYEVDGEKQYVPAEAYKFEGFVEYNDETGQYESITPSSGGYYDARFSAIDESGYTGAYKCQIYLVDRTSLLSTNVNRVGNIYYLNGEFHDSLSIQLHFGWGEDAAYLEEGVDYVIEDGYYYVDSSYDYVKYEGIPSADVDCYKKVVPAEGSSYSGEQYVRCYMDDHDDISYWWDQSRTFRLGEDGIVLPQQAVLYYAVNEADWEGSLYFGEDLEIVRYLSTDEDEDEYEIDEPTTFGEYYAVVKPIEREGSHLHGTKIIEVNVSNPNDISNWDYDWDTYPSLSDDGFDAGELTLEDEDSGTELVLGEDLVIDHYEAWDDDADEYVAIEGEPSAYGEYYVVVKPAEGSSYTGQKRIWFELSDPNDISNWDYGWDTRPSLSDDGFDAGELTLENEDSEVELVLGKDLVIDHYEAWDDDANEYVAIEGEPSAYGEYYVVVKPVEGSSYTGQKRIWFGLSDPYDMRYWNVSRTGNFALIDGKFYMPELELFAGDWENRKPFKEGVDYQLDGFFIEDEDENIKIDGEPTEPGDYCLKYVPAEGSSAFNERWIYFELSDFNDLSDWSLNYNCSTVYVEGDTVTVPSTYTLYRYNSVTGKSAYAHLGTDFTLEKIRAYDDGKEAWIDVESIDGTARKYQLVFQAIEGSGFTGTCEETLWVQNDHDLDCWSVECGDCYFENGNLVAPTVTVWRRNKNGEKCYLVEGKDFDWHWSNKYDGKDIGTPTESGDYYIVVTPHEGSVYSDSTSESVSVGDYNDLSCGWNVSRDRSPAAIDASGTVMLPVFTVYRGKDGEPLVEGVDYTVSYESRKYVGEEDRYVSTPIAGTPAEEGNYSAVINGIGSYTGKASYSFYLIDYRDLSNYELTFGQGFLVNGTYTKPAFSLEFYGYGSYVKLVEGTDFEVAGYQLYDKDLDYVDYACDIKTPTVAGKYVVKLVPKQGSNYRGVAYGVFNVGEKINLSYCYHTSTYYEGSTDFDTKGLGLYTMKNGEKVSLTLGTDYVIDSWEDDYTEEKLSAAPTKPGNYQALVKAVEGGQAVGQDYCYVSIANVPIEATAGNEYSVTSDSKGVTYTGKITASKTGRYTVTPSNCSYASVYFSKDSAFSVALDGENDDSDDSISSNSIILNAGDTVWFKIYFNDYNHDSLSAKYTVSYETACCHKFGDPVYNVRGSACTATVTCSLCGEAKTYKGAVSAAVTKAPTCKAEGQFAYKATFTGGIAAYSWSAAVAKSMVHSKIVTDPAVEATCSKTGLTEGSHCELCGADIVAQEVVAKKAHSIEGAEEKIENTVPATCVAEGSYDRVYYCTVCGEEAARYKDGVLSIDSSNHVNREVLPGTAATTTSTGLTEGLKCKDCGTVITAQQEIPVQTCDHTYGEPAYAVNGTACTAKTTCSKCGDSVDYIGTVTNEVTKAATCTATGVRTYTATFSGVASHSWTVDIDTIAHVKADQPVKENEKAGTCKTKSSYDEVTYCKYGCGTEMERTTKHGAIDPDNHVNKVTIKGKDATYTETGLTEGLKCSDCDTVIVAQKEIPVLDPAQIDASLVKLATASYTYDGTAKKPAVTVTGLTQDTDYTVAYSNNVNAGTATVTVTGKGIYSGTVKKTFTIAKAANAVSAKVAKKTLKLKVLKKKAQSFTIGASAKGGAKLTYKVTKKASNKITVSKTGKVTLKKGAKKGKYVVTVTAAATGNYAAATKAITITVK